MPSELLAMIIEAARDNHRDYGVEVEVDAEMNVDFDEEYCEI